MWNHLEFHPFIDVLSGTVMYWFAILSHSTRYTPPTTLGDPESENRLREKK